MTPKILGFSERQQDEVHHVVIKPRKGSIQWKQLPMDFTQLDNDIGKDDLQGPGQVQMLSEDGSIQRSRERNWG
uniref:Anaphase-promoting complex subunit 13 n=1 Tax=Bursaphelenchus xylophilus TaxID=6326 RepID=A0A1I7RN93_BURXY